MSNDHLWKSKKLVGLKDLLLVFTLVGSTFFVLFDQFTKVGVIVVADHWKQKYCITYLFLKRDLPQTQPNMYVQIYSSKLLTSISSRFSTEITPKLIEGEGSKHCWTFCLLLNLSNA